MICEIIENANVSAFRVCRNPLNNPRSNKLYDNYDCDRRVRMSAPGFPPFRLHPVGYRGIRGLETQGRNEAGTVSNRGGTSCRGTYRGHGLTRISKSACAAVARPARRARVAPTCRRRNPRRLCGRRCTAYAICRTTGTRRPRPADR